jgi:hypothetical protein
MLPAPKSKNRAHTGSMEIGEPKERRGVEQVPRTGMLERSRP